ncbi:lysosomal-associated transmembrane protein 4A-like [Panonychus citri]|uniref:lysosomal-associated transmembrane protein 4A-like n=1 Tax=Panonychus citri TaxID=50023 RepID=UPI0023077B69|nr:lysosomal-associated transmembrane protein 4A-like [Panonychus citri]XP_053207702.1 lysosomal-associated transmembrane protein 4A-like [Panonychus citri]
MNRDHRNNEERYSHFAFLHVKPASLFIGGYFFTTSVLKLIKLSSGYNIRPEDDMRRFMAVNRPTSTLLFMIHLLVAIVSAILIYGVTKSKASYLMPFFGIQLYHFLFSLPSSLSQLNVSANQYRNHYGSNTVTSPSDVRSILRADATHTFSVLATLIDFLCDICFICIIWKCYRYLKMKEIQASLTLPYNIDLEIVVPSEVVSTTNITPPDYETAIKDSPPPDYESAVKLQTTSVTPSIYTIDNN